MCETESVSSRISADREREEARVCVCVCERENPVVRK